MIILLFSLAEPCFAQRDSSLTSDFARMSAKQRSRIALKEQQEAAVDAEFQALMAAAEKEFQRKDHDQALSIYKQARARRPYNVHPKVKIQDLEALIRQRDEALKNTIPETAPVDISPPDEAVPSALPGTTPRMDHGQLANATASTPGPVTNSTADDGTSASPMATRKAPPREPRPEIRSSEARVAHFTGDRIFKEGNAVIEERVVVEDERPVMYRRVSRAWGEEVHFRDGIAISPHAWAEVFGSR